MNFLVIVEYDVERGGVLSAGQGAEAVRRLHHSHHSVIFGASSTMYTESTGLRGLHDTNNENNGAEIMEVIARKHQKVGVECSADLLVDPRVHIRTIQRERS